MQLCYVVTYVEIYMDWCVPSKLSNAKYDTVFIKSVKSRSGYNQLEYVKLFLRKWINLKSSRV